MCLIGGILACTKNVENQIPDDAPMVFNLDILRTKADDDAWVKGDKIYVFVTDIGGKYVSMEYDGKDWNTTTSAEYVKKDFASRSEASLTAVYFPVPVDVSYEGREYRFTSGGEKVYTYYLMATGTAYDIDSTEVKATVEMGKTANFVGISIPGIQAEESDYTLSCPLIRPVACASVDVNGKITEESRQEGARIGGIPYGDGVLFSGALTKPGASQDYTFTFANDYYLYTFTRKGLTLEPGRIYSYQDLPQSDQETQELTNIYEHYVDLGLNVLWAKCNVGATEETEIGDYLSWGELNGYNSGKRDFSWNGYHLRSKYTEGNYSALQQEDDVAYAVHGGQCRVPSYADWEELLKNCNIERKDNGYLFTSKKTGFTDKSIFLPATSYRYNSSRVDALGDVGCYWSSNLYADGKDYAGYAHIAPQQQSIMIFLRCYGCAVRPVRPVTRFTPQLDEPFPGEEKTW